MNAKDNKQKQTNYTKVSAFDFIPTDQISKNVLIQRAKMLSVKHEVNDEQKTSLVNYIRFKLGNNEFYGIPYEKIKEVMNNFLLTSVPNLPSFVAGIINLRGILITVIDLKILFGIPHTESSENPQVIVVNKENMLVGILIDNIIGNDFYDPSSLDLPLLSQSIAPEFILGINQGVTAIINIETILADSNLHLITKSRATL